MYLPNIIGSSASSTTATLVAKNGLKILSHQFDEIQGSNLELKLISYFNNNLSRLGLAGLPTVAVLDFLMFISLPFEELQG